MQQEILNLRKCLLCKEIQNCETQSTWEARCCLLIENNTELQRKYSEIQDELIRCKREQTLQCSTVFDCRSLAESDVTCPEKTRLGEIMGSIGCTEEKSIINMIQLVETQTSHLLNALNRTKNTPLREEISVPQIESVLRQVFPLHLNDAENLAVKEQIIHADVVACLYNSTNDLKQQLIVKNATICELEELVQSKETEIQILCEKNHKYVDQLLASYDEPRPFKNKWDREESEHCETCELDECPDSPNSSVPEITKPCRSRLHDKTEVFCDECEQKYSNKLDILEQTIEFKNQQIESLADNLVRAQREAEKNKKELEILKANYDSLEMKCAAAEQALLEVKKTQRRKHSSWGEMQTIKAFS